MRRVFLMDVFFFLLILLHLAERRHPDAHRFSDGIVANDLHRNEDEDDEEANMDEENALYSSETGLAYGAHLGPTSLEDGTIQIAHSTQPEQQTQQQRHQIPSLPPWQPSLASESTSQSRKRKPEQPKQVQLQVESRRTASDATHGGIINDSASLAVVRSDLDWARINNREEADAVFIAQQVHRANLQRNTLKAYDKYREHWKVNIV